MPRPERVRWINQDVVEYDRGVKFMMQRIHPGDIMIKVIGSLDVEGALQSTDKSVEEAEKVEEIIRTLKGLKYHQLWVKLRV